MQPARTRQHSCFIHNCHMFIYNKVFTLQPYANLQNWTKSCCHGRIKTKLCLCNSMNHGLWRGIQFYVAGNSSLLLSKLCSMKKGSLLHSWMISWHFCFVGTEYYRNCLQLFRNLQGQNAHEPFFSNRWEVKCMGLWLMLASTCCHGTKNSLHAWLGMARYPVD